MSKSGSGVFNWIGGRLSASVKRRLRVFVAAILILAVVHGVASFVIGRKVDGELDKIRAAGDPDTPLDLGLPRVPDNQNAALVYAKAFKILGRKEAHASLNTVIAVQNRHKKPPPWNTIRQAVGQFDGVVPLVEEAVSRPRCQFPVDWGSLWDGGFGHLGSLSRTQHFLSTKAMLAAHDHNMPEALQMVDLEFRLSDSLGEEPAIISQMIRYSRIGNACSLLAYCLQSGPIEPREARQIAATIAKIDLSPGFTKALKGERIILGLDGFRQFRKHPSSFCNAMGQIGAPMWGGGVWPTCEASLPGKPFLNADQLVYFRTMDKIIADSRLPYRMFNAKHEPLFIPWYAAVSITSIPAACKSFAVRDRAQANLALAHVALGLSAYRNEYGEYPADLQELQTRLKWKLPEDPFSGKPLGYRRQGDGFLLYSIGDDLTDDGGQKAVNRGQLGPGDIVWKTDR